MPTRKTIDGWTYGLIFMVVALVPGKIDAQMGRPPAPVPPLAIGARVGLNWADKIKSVGGQVRVPLSVLPGLEILPSADVFLLDGPNEWQLNLDIAAQLLPFVYGGAGVAVARDSLPTSDGPSTETGYNLFLGLAIPSLRFPIKPLVEARWTKINRIVQPFRIVAGVIVPLGRSPSRRR